MDSGRIDELLNKYWNCDTSLEEEQELKAFFRNSEIPAQWKETADLFRYFDEQKNREVDTSVERNVLKAMKPQAGVVRKLFYNSMRIAAGIAVLVIAGWFVRNEIRSQQPVEDTYEDPKIAFEETKKALLMISKSFGTAESKAKKLNMFNEAQDQVRKDLEKSKL